ncbi:dihydroxyacetone kinase operon transcriptional regulator DhaR [Agarivorans sp. TSD2052]|uniref:dihydroxyacetone kinase operon transcriptional regulator DhaR n=1 Tax=Agarivorans sp. TSD2052 TaxID=2937286 RepID=UPI0020104B8A|nr:dihydroxyacetone kinase operon transcriptional regulator DhaR [Agarivorans sp. TSD2052]UPW18069.1 dihydroxyacetone kinase operon transcriptional regulator DhaR [Agarivorans sp. TSD2052]
MTTYLKVTKDIWAEFVSDTVLSDRIAGIDPSLLQTWNRCKRQLSYKQWITPHYAKGISFEAIKKNKNGFLNFSIPVLEDVFEHLENENCSLLLTDETGCTLYSISTPLMKETLSELRIQEGSYWKESSMGNNGVSTAMQQGISASSCGFEHYNQALHKLAIYSSPVIDSSGKVHGSVSMLIPSQHSNAFSTALIHSVSKDISSQIQADTMLNESNQYLSEVNVLLEGVEEGVISWYTDGVIHYLNTKGADLLCLQKSDLGNDVNSLLKFPQQAKRAIRKRKSLELFETTIESKGKLISLLMSINVVKSADNSTHCFIALLYPLRKLHDLVNRHNVNCARHSIDDIIAESDTMSRVKRQAKQIAKTTTPIMIQGEDGLGKSHLAEAIHNLSNRAKGPFVSINCEAIPHKMILNEFLGNRRNAENATPSKLELANGGTLFLDQVEYLPKEAQATLVQVMKTGFLNRIDGYIIPIDIRVIVTSCVDLVQHVEQGRFRKQLMLELQACTIQIPPLRERQSDIPQLVKTKLSQIESFVSSQIDISDESMELLCCYHWPGNHRELQNCIERAASFAKDNKIQAKDLPEILTNFIGIRQQGDEVQSAISISDAEKQAIIRAAILCNGRVSKMIVELDIARTTLWRKLKFFKIDLSDYK